ncbi:MAG: hypothetical protein IPL79_06450 [Myxococcales bacterium]|nr:hypothetical protein [Myxococcales bacterium]
MANRILVVDDEPDEAMAVRDLLVRYGYDVQHRLDGAAALEAIEESPRRI